MKIEVKNFGKIKKGQIDLDKKVTVFVGYNNTGKTYMSQLMWGLYSEQDYSYLGEIECIDENMLINNSFTITSEIISKYLITFNKKIITVFLPDLFNTQPDYFSRNNFTIRVTDLLDIIKSTPFEYWYPYEGDREDLVIYSKLIIKKAADSLDVISTIENFKEPVYYRKSTKNDIKNLGGIQLGDGWPIAENPDFVYIDEAISTHFARTIIPYFGTNNSSHLKVFFLPAKRIFFPSYYKYIYSVSKDEIELIDRRLRNNGDFDSIKGLAKTPYTKPVNALIKAVYNLNLDRNENDFYQDLLSELKEIIGGTIIIKSAAGIAPIEFYLKLDSGEELDMYMASSSANQLATLYLYFQYWAQKDNNFLIIDEPEENLHPKNQIKLVNILMKFADRNNKVLITTHSPLIADLINNYANLSYLKEAGTDVGKLIAENEFEMYPVQNILHKDYGIYFFNGDSIKEYDVNEYGAYFKDFQVAEDKVKDMSDVLKDGVYKNINENARKSLQKK